MIKVFIGEFDCRYESSPYGGFSFYVKDEDELSEALDNLQEKYPGGIRRAISRENGDDERCYCVFSCDGNCSECD